VTIEVVTSRLVTVEVVTAGPLGTVQDLGRPGYAHLGVPRSGALDPPALCLANRLVGNPEGAAGVELTATGGAFRFGAPAAVAVTGALATVTVDGRAASHAAALVLRAGAMLAIGPARDGVRTYLAVAGGVDVPAVLGSRSTDTLSGLGPPVLRDGDVLPIGSLGSGRPATVDFVPPRPATTPLRLRIRFGPRDDRFTEEARAVLLGPYQLSMSSNRVGARLVGAALPRADGGELPSEGIVLGAVQVPADGQPLVFLADHPTTGGYPVIAVVDRIDLAGLAQARPGDTVTFVTSEVRRGPQR
jgi:biotin-dependent carboxylase-like uncharacterized protein